MKKKFTLGLLLIITRHKPLNLRLLFCLLSWVCMLEKISCCDPPVGLNGPTENGNWDSFCAISCSHCSQMFHTTYIFSSYWIGYQRQLQICLALHSLACKGQGTTLKIMLTLPKGPTYQHKSYIIYSLSTKQLL